MTSRLSQMQARFQQRQMQEKEEKLLRLYENQQQRTIERVNRGSAGSNTSVTSVTSITSTNQAGGGGKVRQMFDERRQKAGIDRSYPLEPIRNSSTTTNKTNGHARGNSLERLKNSSSSSSSKTVVKTTVQKSVSQIKNGKPIVNKREVVHSIYNNNDGDESYEEHRYEDDNGNGPTIMNKTYRQKDLELMMNNVQINDNLDDEEFPDVDIDEFDEPKPNNPREKISSQNGTSTKRNVEQKVFVRNDSSPEKHKVFVRNGSSPEKRSVSPKKETKSVVKKTVARVVVTPSSAVSSGGARSPPSPSKASPLRSPSKGKPEITIMSSRKPSSAQKRPSDYQRAPSTSRPSSKPSTRGPSTVIRDDLEACKYCSRRFASDRLKTHEDICARTAKKKRKTYDATKHRVQGTELEPYTRKSNRTANVRPDAVNPIPLKQQNSKQSGKQSASKKSEWRRKHEEFISAIRAAKMAQAHVAKGGKLSDLPPPPPSYNPDYVQCPHCGRRFNETAAQRHIPKCATYDFNKTKAPAARPGGRPPKR